MAPEIPESSATEIDQLIGHVIESRLTAAESERLSALLAKSPDAVQQYIEALDTHAALCEIFPDSCSNLMALEALQETPVTLPSASEHHPLGPTKGNSHWSPPLEWMIVLAAVFFVGFMGYLMGQGDSASPKTAMTPLPLHLNQPEQSPQKKNTIDARETTLAGHGILRQTIDVAWPKDQKTYLEGSLLEPGEFSLESGIVVIDFFSGATLAIRGPAHLDIVSDWAVTVHEGKLEATIPPAAQGFTINAADTEIIDLGTQFALHVSANEAQVAVLDGEVMLRGDRFADDRLLTGERVTLLADPVEAVERDFIGLIPRLEDITSRKEEISHQRFRQYRQFIDKFAGDPQLIAFYPPCRNVPNRLLPNVAGAAHAGNAQLIGPVEIAPGRFSGESVGLGFRRPGSRARMKLDGTFSAYSFSCWAKIDSLAHRYNALFLADGYENGEPHWQIRSDGRLMFSVMVDEDRELVYPGGPKTPPIHDAGFHHVYFSQPVWNKSLAGAWLHLVAVYDPASRKVIQYVNGNEVARETIADEFLISDLHIGAAEIGNWGQPFRATPDFAVRNLDGVIDEMLITSKPLSPKEIVDLYQQGKPK